MIELRLDRKSDGRVVEISSDTNECRCYLWRPASCMRCSLARHPQDNRDVTFFVVVTWQRSNASVGVVPCKHGLLIYHRLQFVVQRTYSQANVDIANEVVQPETWLIRYMSTRCRGKILGKQNKHSFGLSAFRALSRLPHNSRHLI